MAWPTVVVDTTDMDAAGDNPGNARAAIKQMADNVNAIKDMRGVADGIASTDATNKVPVAQLPTIPANKGGTGQTAFTIGDIFYASSTSALSKLASGASGTVLTSNGAGAAPSYQTAGGVPSGTRMSFQQTAAPTGWTKDTTAAINDAVLRLVTGTAGSGGSTAFSTFNGQTATGATTLTSAEIPSHSHVHKQSSITTSFTGTTSTSYLGNSNIYKISTDINNTTSIAAAGSGGSHTHTVTTSIKYYDFIIASKD